jgi:hypothetical protein
MDTYTINKKKVRDVEEATASFVKHYELTHQFNIARKILFNFALAESGGLDTYQIKRLHRKYRNEEEGIDKSDYNKKEDIETELNDLLDILDGLLLTDLVRPVSEQYVNLEISPIGRAVLIESSHGKGLLNLYKEIEHKKRIKNRTDLLSIITQKV